VEAVEVEMVLVKTFQLMERGLEVMEEQDFLTL
jgi:hypothetical protein